MNKNTPSIAHDGNANFKTFRLSYSLIFKSGRIFYCIFPTFDYHIIYSWKLIMYVSLCEREYKYIYVIRASWYVLPTTSLIKREDKQILPLAFGWNSNRKQGKNGLFISGGTNNARKSYATENVRTVVYYTKRTNGLLFLFFQFFFFNFVCNISWHSLWSVKELDSRSFISFFQFFFKNKQSSKLNI